MVSTTYTASSCSCIVIANPQPARAIKALDRILKRLKNAITGLLHTNNKKDDLHLDYGSLMTLSNASRHDAIKAIDGLSRRLRSPASASAVSSSAAKAPSTKAQSRRKRKSSPDTEASRSKPKQETRRDKSPSKKSSAASAKTSKAASREHTTSKAEAERLRKRAPAPPQPPKAPSTTPHKTRPSRSAATAASGGTQRPATPKTPKAAAEPPQNRISMLSFSSDSTKLGEIPQRKWQRREEMVRYSPSTSNDPDDGGGSTEYGVRPMFPLRPYTVEVKERRFLGWFSRRREA